MRFTASSGARPLDRPTSHLPMEVSAVAKPRFVYTVSQLNREVRFVLSEHFGSIWVEGEISNLASPSSGHLYFTLKDAEAQARCAMFRGNTRMLTFRPENGTRVLVKAQVGLYEPRGDYQLVVDYMEEAGDGALRQAFEALKQRLAGEGLFDSTRKKPIPVLPGCIGVITSPTGAAVRDILTVLKRRFPALPVIIFPVKVQGTEAKHEIARAIALADRLELCDVLILARGGGSLEDLWAFNEEIVARAIYASATPIIAGVGHEVDLTIADLVADLRAPTPSAAAEAVSPDQNEWLARFDRIEARLRHHVRMILTQRTHSLGFLSKRLQQAHPEKRLQVHAQRLDELELRLQRAARNSLSQREARLHTLAAQILRHHPRQRLLLLEARQSQLNQRLGASIKRLLERQRQGAAALGQKLHAVSPLATLARGYAIATRRADRKILRDWREVKKGELIETRLFEGILLSRVEDTRAE